MRSYSLSLTLLLASTTLIFACQDNTSSPPITDLPDEDVGIIYPPDTGKQPHCIDAGLVPECETAADCVGVFEPMPTCRVAVCDAGACALELAEDGVNCDDQNVCTSGETCQAGECVGGDAVCECQVDEDCAQYDDDNLCNGSFKCDTTLTDPVCVIDPATVVACMQPGNSCQVSECDPDTGSCEVKDAKDGTPCDTGDPCIEGDHCVAGECQPGDQNICTCPAGMVPVGEAYCIDQYEASRADATTTNRGQDNTVATSRAGVLPWMPIEFEAGRDACEAAGKRLCTPDEFQIACAGPTNSTYTYGNIYNPTICNGIDAYCRCDVGACAELDVCPYPHCYNQAPDGTAGGCGSDLKLMPTGSFSDCVNEHGAFDLSGNVWELVDRGDGASWYAGGAYNCIDSEALHQCGSLQKNVSARGFRCCADYGTGTP